MFTGPCSDGRSSNANVAGEQCMALLARYEMNGPAPDAARQRSKLSLLAPSSVRRGLATTILQVSKEAITALNRDITTTSIDATSDEGIHDAPVRCETAQTTATMTPISARLHTLRGEPSRECRAHAAN